MQYSYSFSEELQQEWRWTERYAAQPEILRYADHVADRLDLRRNIQLDTVVEQAVFDESSNRWLVRTSRGNGIAARFCIMATGCLSVSRVPDFDGIERFEGDIYRTANWPHEEVEFAGRRVGIIGTGSSAIQALPVIARKAAHVFVFQRTPNFSVPARNGPLDPKYESAWKANYTDRRRRARLMRSGILYEMNDKSALEVTDEERRREFEARWEAGGLAFMAAFNDLILNSKANEAAAVFVRDQIRAAVTDLATAELLSPHGYPIGTKRLCVDTGYYEAFNRGNVTLVDISRTPIQEVTPTGLQAGDSAYELDALVFATGFDAMTGALARIDIRGRDGLRLAEKWTGGPRTYLGLMSAGFPNLFFITGPGSPSVLSNMIVSIEQHVDWISECLNHIESRDVVAIEPTVQAEDEWVAHVDEVANRTLYPSARSWYMGANIPGKARVFLPYAGGVGVYRDKCDEVARLGYEGFSLTYQNPSSGTVVRHHREGSARRNLGRESGAYEAQSPNEAAPALSHRSERLAGRDGGA